MPHLEKDESWSYSITDDREERHQVYGTKPPFRANRVKEKRWKELEREPRKDEREHKSLERRENYQD